MTQLVIEKESFNTKDFVLPYSILHGYGERPALFQESDVGLEEVVNISVQLGSRGQGRNEVLEIFHHVDVIYRYLQQGTKSSQESHTALRATSHLTLEKIIQ